jgi:menaquinone-dependent protoporphyrinogen oxidase
MARILIAYATKEGHTAKIAEHMREALAAGGHDVLVERVEKRPSELPPGLDGVIVGGSIHAAKHLPELVGWVRANRDRLEALPSAFFTVCLTAADDSPESQAETQVVVDRFLEDTGWQAPRTAVFAGRLAWTQYDFFTRQLMKLIVRQHGSKDLDTSRDYDYTDYDTVARFAEELAAGLDGTPSG